MAELIIHAHVMDIRGRSISPATVRVEAGRITSIGPAEAAPVGYLTPGLVDAHVHVESSMLPPVEFARLAVTHGTVATVSDPHEIGNVLGVEGVELMLDQARDLPFKFHFGAPPCVPATPFETAGATITSDQVGALLERPEVVYLSEVMNFPGVLQGDPDLLAKIEHARRRGKRVDGHAPGLRGADAARYAAAGISSDHECSTAEEALDKLACGMLVQIREGSAARNFEALIDLLPAHPERMAFCSDDKHPDGLVHGHINSLCARAVQRGIDPFTVLRAACTNTVEHYGLQVGQLRVGDPADMVLWEDLEHFRALRTWVNGTLVAEAGKTLIAARHCPSPNNFHCTPKSMEQLHVPATTDELLVIEALDGQLITRKRRMHPKVLNGACIPDMERDLLRITVVDRYTNGAPAVGWIHGFGLKEGALASSVAHDSHNIVAVGADDADLLLAVNAVIAAKGGVCVVHQGKVDLLPLPIAGIMSDRDAYAVAADYERLETAARALGSTLGSPFMTLSFMALLVIPHLKMSDRGLFDGDTMQLIR